MVDPKTATLDDWRIHVDECLEVGTEWAPLLAHALLVPMGESSRRLLLQMLYRLSSASEFSRRMILGGANDSADLPSRSGWASLDGNGHPTPVVYDGPTLPVFEFVAEVLEGDDEPV